MKTDCLNYDAFKKTCVAFNSDYCENGECKFYKNKRMLDEQVKKIRERIPDYMPFRGYTPSY